MWLVLELLPTSNGYFDYSLRFLPALSIIVNRIFPAFWADNEMVV